MLNNPPSPSTNNTTKNNKELPIRRRNSFSLSPTQSNALETKKKEMLSQKRVPIGGAKTLPPPPYPNNQQNKLISGFLIF